MHDASCDHTFGDDSAPGIWGVRFAGQRGAAGPVNADVNAETALARASERPVRSSRCKMPLKTTN